MRPDIAFFGNFRSSSRPANSLAVELPIGITEQARKGCGDETFASTLGGFCDYQVMTRLLRFLTPLLAGCAVTLLQVVIAVALLAPEKPIAERYSALVQHDSYWFMRVEDRMREIFGSAECGLRNADWWLANIVIVKIADVRAAEDGHQQFNIPGRGRFIERNADCAWPKCAQVATGFGRVLQNYFARFHFDSNRVEEIVVRHYAAEGAQTIGKSTR